MNLLDEKRPLLIYDGKLGDLYGIFFRNLLLQIVTLGIYRFWATTNSRRYIWSHMRFQDERFEYTGTGGELFKGFLIAIMVVFSAIFAAGVLSVVLRVQTNSVALGALPVIALYLLIVALAAGAFFGAQRYRLSRTRWCGIRGGMTGSALGYGVRAWSYALLCVLTLGQMTPWASMRLTECRINASSFGSLAFRFKGRAWVVYGLFFVTFVGVVVLFAMLFMVFLKSALASMHVGHVPGAGQAPSLSALGSLFLFCALFFIGTMLIRGFYVAALARHVMGNTSLGSQLRFGSNVSVSRLLGFQCGNLAIVVFTLGFGAPIVLHRLMRLAADTLQVSGYLDRHMLGQSAVPEPRTGEGMLNLLDHGGVF
ncbi:YjgN family protein [Paraburkholderia sp. HP33-1]|uniref:YjgN family protein n=1 Tax=Paraburkholderia sp. HP33-1 TaxID=2883243 RepID=UPI001F1ADE54|nr:YjgN family protein [Paraburkholderia sp. HP33-1]